MNINISPSNTVVATEKFDEWQNGVKKINQRDRIIACTLVAFFFIAIAAAVILTAIFAPGVLITVVLPSIGAIVLVLWLLGILWLADYNSDSYGEEKIAQTACYRLTRPGTLEDYISEKQIRWSQSDIEIANEWQKLERYGYLPSQLIKESSEIEAKATATMREIEKLSNKNLNSVMTEQQRETTDSEIQTKKRLLATLETQWEEKKAQFPQHLPFCASGSLRPCV